MRLGVVLSSNEKMLNLGVLHLSTMLRSQVHSSNERKKEKINCGVGEGCWILPFRGILVFQFLGFLGHCCWMGWRTEVKGKAIYFGIDR